MAGWWKVGEAVFQAAQHQRSASRAQAVQCDLSCGYRLVQVLSHDMRRRRPHGSNNVRLAQYSATPCRKQLASWRRSSATGGSRRAVPGSHRVLVRGERQRVWAYHDGVDLGGPAMARVAKDYGYTLAELRKL